MAFDSLKSFVHAGRQAPLYFYRDKEQHEIDMLIHEGGVLHPVEFKRTASPSRNDVEQFGVLRRFGQPIGSGALLCLVGEELPLSSQVDALPVRHL